MPEQPRGKLSLLKRLVPVFIVLFGVGLAVIILVTGKSKPNEPFAATSTLAACQKSGDISCYKQYVETRASQRDPKTAIADVRAIYETDSYVKSQCHELMHSIGHAAFKKYGSIAEAYTKGDIFCWSGYYHGVTEEAIGSMGAENVRKQANTTCAELANARRYSFEHYNCVHGLGHGFYTVASADLFEALMICDLLTDNWEQQSCYGGVFMENVMVSVRNDGTTEYLKPDQPMYPCTAVGDRYKNACYLMQTSYVLQQNGYDFAATFAACRAIPDTSLVETCYQSIGRDASGSTTSDKKLTKQHCEKAPDESGLEYCVRGAARDFVSYFHSDKQGKEFCMEFSEPLSMRCIQEVESYYRSF
jgi:hypothetical protein